MVRPRYFSRLGLGGSSEESTAAGIYGVIVSSAVMAASHAATAAAATVAVLVTLVIYWGAERYARIVAERIHSGRRPDRRELRHQLTTGWEMVTASFLPLAVLDVARLLGAQLSTALLAGLSCSTLLLGDRRLGGRPGRKARHRGTAGVRRGRGRVRRRDDRAQDAAALSSAAPGGLVPRG